MKTKSSLSEKLQEVRKILNEKVFEREEETDGILLGILSGENVLFIGEVGTAKTYHIQLASKLLGLSTFDILLSETVKPDQIFGPTDIPALAEGKQQFKYKGYAPDCDILFFDEVFKANATVLNPLLWIMNEHKFRDGDNGIMYCDTKTVFGASNEIPSDTTLKAIYDRFLLRYKVSYLKDDLNVKKLVGSFLFSSKDLSSVISKNEMNRLIESVSQVKVPEKIQEKAISIRRLVEHSLGNTISDRRFLKSFKVMQASAVLNGRTTVEAQDLEVLANIFWEELSQIFKVQSLVYSKSSMDTAELSTYLEQALMLKDELNCGGDLKIPFKKLNRLFWETKKFKSRYARQISLEIKSIGMLFLNLIKERKKFKIVITSMEDSIRLTQATANVWTYEELRNMGFKKRRKMNYWYYPSSLKSLKSTLKKKGVSLVKRSVKNNV